MWPIVVQLTLLKATIVVEVFVFFVYVVVVALLVVAGNIVFSCG